MTVARECPVQMTTPEYWQLQDELYSSVEIAEAFPRWPDPHLVGIVQPAIGGGPSPSPLMLWWALLLGLSSLVRYYPAVWVRAIDLDESILASPLRQVLDVAIERVPARVLDTPFGVGRCDCGSSDDSLLQRSRVPACSPGSIHLPLIGSQARPAESQAAGRVLQPSEPLERRTRYRTPLERLS